MFSIGCLRVCSPLVLAVKLFNKPFGQQPLKIANEDNVVLAVEVNPALVTVTGVVTLGLTGGSTVENLVKRLLMDIPQHHVKILTEGNITAAMHYKTTHDALAA